MVMNFCYLDLGHLGEIIHSDVKGVKTLQDRRWYVTAFSCWLSSLFINTHPVANGE